MKLEEIQQLSDEEFMKLDWGRIFCEDFSIDDLVDETYGRISALMSEVFNSNLMVKKWFNWNDAYFEDRNLWDMMRIAFEPKEN